LSGNDNEAHNAVSNIHIYFRKNAKLFVMLINIATLILKGRSQRGQRSGTPANRMLPRTAKNNKEQILDFKAEF